MKKEEALALKPGDEVIHCGGCKHIVDAKDIKNRVQEHIKYFKLGRRGK